MRDLTSLRRTYDHQVRRHGRFVPQDVPLRDRRRRLHSEPRYTDGDISLRYAGPVVVCLEHRQRAAPAECTVRAKRRRLWPGAPHPYDVWRSREDLDLNDQSNAASTSRTKAQTGPSDEDANHLQSMQTLDDAGELPLLGAVDGVPVPQIEALNDSGQTATLAIEDLREKSSGQETPMRATAGGAPSTCTLALYHRFDVRGAPPPENSEWCVYVLHSASADATKNGYVGVTPLVAQAKRLAAHNGLAPNGALATHGGRPWHTVRVQRGFATRLDAETVEAQIHRMLPAGDDGRGGPLGPLDSCLTALDSCLTALDTCVKVVHTPASSSSQQ